MKAAAFLSRKTVSERIGLTAGKMAEFFPPDECPGRLIPEARVLSFLNDRRHGSPVLSGPVPALVTDKAVVESGVVSVDGKPLTLRRLRAMCRSSRFPIPHFRLFEHGGFRFYPGAVEWWLSWSGKGIYLNLVPPYTYGAAPYTGPALGHSYAAHRRAGLVG